MKKANIFRSIFWGLIMLIVLTLGIFGVIYNNNEFKDKEDDLERIVNIFNNNSTIKEYEKFDTKIKASLKGKKIIIEYKAATTKTYTFNFKRKYLETNIETNDTIGKVIVMAIADSISVNKGGFEGDIYELFTNENIYKYTLTEGIEYINKGDRYIIKINLENSIEKPLNSNYPNNTENNTQSSDKNNENNSEE